MTEKKSRSDSKRSKIRPHHTKENPPTWLVKGLEDIKYGRIKNKHYVRSIMYYWRVLQATGPWTNHEEIDKIYAECALRRARGENVVVDHVVPISSAIVCGLQCHWNMEIITETENNKKSNRWWPDCPAEINGIPEQPDLLESFDPVVGQLGFCI